LVGVGSLAGLATAFSSAGDLRLFTGLSHLYSLYVHLTIAIAMEYCQYGKSIMFSMIYRLVLLYLRVGIGESYQKITVPTLPQFLSWPQCKKRCALPGQRPDRLPR